LRKTGVKNSDLVFQHRHAQTAEDTLQNHCGNRNYPKIANPLSLFITPEPDREDDR